MPTALVQYFALTTRDILPYKLYDIITGVDENYLCGASLRENHKIPIGVLKDHAHGIP